MELHIPGEWESKRIDNKGKEYTGFPPFPSVTVQFVCRPHDIARPIDLLIDTGADSTTILPDDRDKLGITEDMVFGAREMKGVGGSAETRFLDNVKLLFDVRDSEETPVAFNLDPVSLVWPSEEKRPDYQGNPSLLGRDFLSNCTIKLDPEKDKVLMTVEV